MACAASPARLPCCWRRRGRCCLFRCIPAVSGVMNLFRRSNQNGAPSETATMLKSQPRMWSAHWPLVAGTDWGSIPRLVRARPTHLVLPAGSGRKRHFHCSGGVAACARLLACSTSSARSVESVHSVLAICSVSALAPSTRTAAMTTVHICVVRLYQPETRSMVSLNQASMSFCAWLRSFLEV